MFPVMVLVMFFTVLISFPLVWTARFFFRDREVDKFVERLRVKLPEDRGVVHAEKLEFGRLEVWNKTFVGHRTGFTQRTAIAEEIFLQLPEKGKGIGNMFNEDGTVKEPGSGGSPKKMKMTDSPYKKREAMDEQMKIHKVSLFVIVCLFEDEVLLVLSFTFCMC